MGGPSAVGAMFGMLGKAVQISDQESQFKRNEHRLSESIETASAQSADAYKRGGILAGVAREKGSALQAQQKSAYTDAGVDASVGTAADVAAETAIKAEHEANVISNNAAREAWGFQRSKLDLERQRSDAARQQSQAGGAAALGILSDFGTALSSFSGGEGGGGD